MAFFDFQAITLFISGLVFLSRSIGIFTDEILPLVTVEFGSNSPESTD